jgi:hypothetical protein
MRTEMARILSKKDAYERIAEALNYLEERKDEPHQGAIKHEIVNGNSGAVQWSPSQRKWVTIEL